MNIIFNCRAGTAAMGRAVDFFRSDIQAWQKCLGTIEAVMRILLMVQRAWSALEAIFLGSQDIRAQLPDDTKRFEGIDAEFKETMMQYFCHQNRDHSRAGRGSP